MRVTDQQREGVIESKRTRLRRFLDAAADIHEEAEGLGKEEINARLEQLKQAAYEDYLAENQAGTGRKRSQR